MFLTKMLENIQLFVFLGLHLLVFSQNVRSKKSVFLRTIEVWVLKHLLTLSDGALRQTI